MSQALPLISVVIPSYNKGGLILAAVDSIKKSDYAGPVEIIIIDDYSTDPLTKKAYASLKAAYPDIRIEESGGKGPGTARNKGMGLATGEYLVFLDNDDFISPRFLSAAYAHLKGQDQTVAYVYGDTVVFGRATAWRPTPEFSASRIRIANFVPVTCLYRIGPLRASGGMTTEVSAMEDWDFFLTLLDKGYGGSKIPSDSQALLFYRQADQGGVNASVAGSKQRMRLRTIILKRHNLPSKLVWNVAAVIFGVLKPVMAKREIQSFKRLPVEKQEAINSLITQAHTAP